MVDLKGTGSSSIWPSKNGMLLLPIFLHIALIFKCLICRKEDKCWLCFKNSVMLHKDQVICNIVENPKKLNDFTCKGDFDI